MHTELKEIEMQKKIIERDYSRLQKVFSEFTEIKQSIDALITSAPTNPQAQSKLIQLNNLFPNGIQEMNANALQDVKKLSAAVKKLKTRIDHVIENPSK